MQSIPAVLGSAFATSDHYSLRWCIQAFSVWKEDKKYNESLIHATYIYTYLYFIAKELIAS